MAQPRPVKRVVRTARDVVLKVLPGGRDDAEREGPRIPIPVTPPPQLRAVGEKVRDVVAGDEEPEEASAPVAASPSGKPYEQWTKAELYERAQALDIEGRSKMNKDELIAALRDA